MTFRKSLLAFVAAFFLVFASAVSPATAVTLSLNPASQSTTGAGYATYNGSYADVGSARFYPVSSGSLGYFYVAPTFSFGYGHDSCPATYTRISSLDGYNGGTFAGTVTASTRVVHSNPC